jgi:hypothetical protein
MSSQSDDGCFFPTEDYSSTADFGRSSLLCGPIPKSSSCTCLEGNCCQQKRLCSEGQRYPGQTCLHLVCQNGMMCSETTIRKLIAEYPGALARRDMYSRVVRFLYRLTCLYTEWHFIPLQRRKTVWQREGLIAMKSV